MELNPIVRCELIRTARRPRHFVMRAALGLVPLYVAWALYAFWAQSTAISGARERLMIVRHLPQLADLVFLGLAWVQGLVVLLLVPALVAGSIANEDRRGTMLDLLATPFSTGSIVLGKLVAQLAHVGVAVGVGLPIVLPLLLLGALDLVIVALAYALLLALTVFAAALSLLVSVFVRSPRLAIPSAYLLVGGWILLPVWYAPIAGRLGSPFSWLRVLNDWILESHPREAAMYLWQIAAARLFDPPNVTWAWSGFLKTFARVLAFQATCSALFLVLTAGYLRPLRLGLHRRHGRVPAVSSRSPVGDDPMLWKERHAPARFSRAAVGVSAVLVGVLLFCPLIEPGWAAFQEWQASWSGRPTGLGARRYLNVSLRQFSAGLYCLGLVAVTAVAASSITGERERGTWTSLAMTLVSGREVVRAKVSGTLWAVRGLSIPFSIAWGLGLATGSVHPLGVLAAATGSIIYARYAAALGVLCSMRSSSSDRAITAALLALTASNAVALLFVPLDLVGPLAGSWQTVYLAGVTPLVEWISLASPSEIRWWLEGRNSEAVISLPWDLWGTLINLGPGLIRTYLASLILYSIGTLAVMRVAAGLYRSDRNGLDRLTERRRPKKL